MNEISLPGPERDYALVPTLALIGRLEREAALLDTAQKLLAQELPARDALCFLRACYRAAGCEVEEAALDAFLLARSPLPLLAGVIARLLSPLADMGLARPGKPGTARRA